MIDDANICLVGNVDVDVLDTRPFVLKNRVCGVDKDTRRELEHLTAVHLHEPVGIVEQARAASG